MGAVHQHRQAQQRRAPARVGEQAIGQGIECRLGNAAAMGAHQCGEELLLLA